MCTTKIASSSAALENSKQYIHVLGGIGFTWEVDAHLYLKRAWVLSTHFGAPEQRQSASPRSPDSRSARQSEDRLHDDVPLDFRRAAGERHRVRLQAIAHQLDRVETRDELRRERAVAEQVHRELAQAERRLRVGQLENRTLGSERAGAVESALNISPRSNT